MIYSGISERNTQDNVDRALGDSKSNWVYSEEMVVGRGPNHHAGCYLAVEVPLVLSVYHGRVEFARLNGSSHEFKDAKNGLFIAGEEVQPGDRIQFRFEHKGKKMRRAITHLVSLVCHDSN